MSRVHEAPRVGDVMMHGYSLNCKGDGGGNRRLCVHIADVNIPADAHRITWN